MCERGDGSSSSSGGSGIGGGGGIVSSNPSSIYFAVAGRLGTICVIHV